MEHIISVLVENKFGVLARVAGLFSARGYNIESLSVAATLDPTTSRITIVTIGDDRIIEQIMKQLNKVVEVLEVVDLTETDFLDPRDGPYQSSHKTRTPRRGHTDRRHLPGQNCRFVTNHLHNRNHR